MWFGEPIFDTDLAACFIVLLVCSKSHGTDVHEWSGMFLPGGQSLTTKGQGVGGLEPAV